MKQGRLILIAASAMLAACEARIGKDDETTPAGTETAEAAVEGKAEEGTFSIDAPGFQVKIAIPEGMRDRANIDSDSEIIPPGATFSGIHIQAAQDGANNGVELRFTDGRAPEELAGWYRSSAQGSGFTIGSVDREGDAFVISGKTKNDGDDFTVRLTSMAGGGTDGRLAVSDRRR